MYFVVQENNTIVPVYETGDVPGVMPCPYPPDDAAGRCMSSKYTDTADILRHIMVDDD